MTFLETILEEVLRIFKREGVEANSEEELIKKLDIRPNSFKELFTSKSDMVLKTIKFDIEEQKRQHAHILANAQNPVEEIMILLQDGIRNIQQTNPRYIIDLQLYYPQIWEFCLDHLNTYSYHQTFDIINKGIMEGLFRKDINIQLVTKIILEMLTLMLNPEKFPPEQYNLAEVFRSIYLYYVRGICTETGGKLAEDFFARNSF